MNPMEQFEPFVKKNKIDLAGAVAVYGAVAKYSMRFVSVKEAVKIRTCFWGAQGEWTAGTPFSAG